MWANLHGDPAEWHETIHVHVRNVGCMRVERLSVTNYKIIKGSLVANFRYTNFWVAGQE